jgi:transposase
MNTQFMSLKRCELFFSEVMKASISQGSLVNWQKQGFESLEFVEQRIASALRVSDVLHADETGIHVNGKLNWWHSASTRLLTHYHIAKHRGLKGLLAGGILEDFEGVLVHDCWVAYFQLRAIHALCNAHLLRELTRVFETTGQVWALNLKSLLCTMKVCVERVEMLTCEKRVELQAGFKSLVEQGLEANPERERTEKALGKRGRVGQGFTRSLLIRLQTHEASWLRFLHDPRVRFDNNLAERDVRMVKVREKVSGGSRGSGAVWFARIRGYISTLRKQGQDVFQAFEQLFVGCVVLPVSLVEINAT